VGNRVTDFSDNMLNAFCVDLEEWFHVCGVKTSYSNPASWAAAPSCVERDTEVLLRLLDEAGAKGTFLAVGWLAEKYPRLIERISRLGHEIGCHGYYHRLIYEQTPDEFRREVAASRRILQEASGQPVTCFRAPGFSMRRECFWAYPILAEQGIQIDVSIVPSPRDHGGVAGLSPLPFTLRTGGGKLSVFPVSVMRLAGRTTPFSGGGYLRLFPVALIQRGFRQAHRQGLPVMAYIHPREINPAQPRLKLPLLKSLKYYIGLSSCERKLRRLLGMYRFGTVSEVLRRHGRGMRTYYLDQAQRGFTPEPPDDSPLRKAA